MTESKTIPSQAIFQTGVRAYRDSDLPEYTYCGAETIFKQNLNTSSVGKKITVVEVIIYSVFSYVYIVVFSDPSLVRAALMPCNDTHQHCSNWLDTYFKRYGDFAPNKDEIKLAITRKKEIYSMYVADFSGRPVLDEQKFYVLWNTLFPRCVSRPWCDIPGKCETCYEIDRGRRESTDPEVQESLRQAHLIHRGGMFMLERNE
jgi:hypothetical protein